MNSNRTSKPTLLGNRASSKSAVKKLAPIDANEVKNKDLIMVENPPELDSGKGSAFDYEKITSQTAASSGTHRSSRGYNS